MALRLPRARAGDGDARRAHKTISTATPVVPTPTVPRDASRRECRSGLGLPSQAGPGRGHIAEDRSRGSTRCEQSLEYIKHRSHPWHGFSVAAPERRVKNGSFYEVAGVKPPASGFFFGPIVFPQGGRRSLRASDG